MYLKKRFSLVLFLCSVLLVSLVSAAPAGTLDRCIQSGRCLDGAGKMEVTPPQFIAGTVDTVEVRVPVSTEAREKLKAYKKSGVFYSPTSRWTKTAFTGTTLGTLWVTRSGFTVADAAVYPPGEYLVAGVLCTGRVGGKWNCPRENGKYKYTYQKFTVFPSPGELVIEHRVIPSNELWGVALPRDVGVRGAGLAVTLSQPFAAETPIVIAAVPLTVPTEEAGSPLGGLAEGQDVLKVVQFIPTQKVAAVLQTAVVNMTLTAQELGGRKPEDIVLVHLKTDGTVGVYRKGAGLEIRKFTNGGGTKYEYKVTVPSLSVFVLAADAAALRCSDSDPGQEYAVQGTVTVGVDSSSDVCLAEGQLQEFFCTEGVGASEIVDCPSGHVCLAGACAQGVACDTASGGRLRATADGSECVCPTNKILHAETGTCGFDLRRGLLGHWLSKGEVRDKDFASDPHPLATGFNLIQQEFQQKSQQESLSNILSLSAASKGMVWDYMSFADGGYASIPLPDSWTQTHAMTVAAWVKPRSFIGYQAVVALQPRGRQRDGGIVLGLYGNRPFFEKPTLNTRFNRLMGTTLLQAGIWFHLTAVYDGQSMKIYVRSEDGIMVGMDEKTDSSGVELSDATRGYPSPAQMFIGAFRVQSSYGMSSNPFGHPADAPNAYFFDGQIKEVRIYDRVLSSEEIQVLQQ